MDAPPIQYARTEDGVNIAYTEWGSGPTWLFVTAPQTSDLTALWQTKPHALLFERIRAEYHLVVMATRGAGSSDRDVDDLSPSATVPDIAAVLAAVGARSAIVHTATSGVPAAVLFANAYPGRVELLVLSSPYARGRDLYSDNASIFLGISTLAQADWPLAARSALTAQGHADADLEAGVELLTASLTAEQYLRRVDATMSVDITADLAHLTTPTLVFRNARQQISPKLVREVAGAIPGAKLVAIPGFDDTERWADAIFSATTSLLGEEQQPTTTARPTDSSPGLRTLLFTDLESSTALTQSLGDAKALDILNGHNAAVRSALTDHGGEEVKHTGDGIMAWFPAASNGLDSAQAIQQGVADLANPDLGVKIGLNAGEPIAEEDDLYGTAVQIAARVTDQAGAGEIVCTNVVRELVAGKSYLFGEREPAALKGVEEPVRLFTLGKDI